MIALLAYNTNTYVCGLDHTHIITTVTYTQHSLLLLPELFDSFSQCAFLLWRASAADDRWHLHSSLIEILDSLFLLLIFLLQYIHECLAINNQHFLQIFLGILPFGLPIVGIVCLLYLDILLGSQLESA